MNAQLDAGPSNYSQADERKIRNKWSWSALRLVLIYVSVGGAWIWFSDRLLMVFTRSPEAMTRLATYKGWGFVIVTASLLYVALLVRFRRESRALREAETALREKVDYSLLAWRIGGVASFDYDIRLDQLRLCPPIAELENGGGARTGLARLMERVLPEDLPELQTVLGRADDPSGDGGFEMEFRVRGTDGLIRWLRTQGQTLFESEGSARRAVRRVGMMLDVSDRKRLEEQFLHAQRMDAVGTLASGVAHDLNNILAPMLMGAGLLRSRLANPDDRKMLELIERSAQRGASIVRQLLSFGRGTEGIRSPLRLRHLVEELGSFVEETFPRNIAVTVDAPADLWAVHGDATQVYQVLMNLCVNARDAMPDGGKLTVEARNVELTGNEERFNPEGKAGPYVALTVIDSGFGMPPETVHRIFEPFFTTKEPGKGTGLGLSTAHEIIRGHGGFIAVVSEPGRGSTFKAYLPAEKRSAEAASRDTTVPMPVGRGELVLVVDDEAPIREMAREVLENHCYRALVAANGAEAIQLFVEQRENVRLVLADILMPVMDGVTLIRSLRVLDPKLKLKVIGMSGLGQQTRQAELCALGVTNMLVKPFGQKELLNAVGLELSTAP